MAKTDSPKDETIITEALERFEDSYDGSEYNRETAHDDITFARLADQWPGTIKRQREEEGRPCLTINKLPAFARQVVNDARQNKPSIQVNAVDNGADVDTARVINGVIRSIERNSNADVAYDTAMDHSVSGGFGFFRLGESVFAIHPSFKRKKPPRLPKESEGLTSSGRNPMKLYLVLSYLTYLPPLI